MPTSMPVSLVMRARVASRCHLRSGLSDFGGSGRVEDVLVSKGGDGGGGDGLCEVVVVRIVQVQRGHVLDVLPDDALDKGREAPCGRSSMTRSRADRMNAARQRSDDTVGRPSTAKAGRRRRLGTGGR